MDSIIDYATTIGANQEIIDWCKTTLAAAHRKEPVSVVDAEHVVDFLMSNDAPSRLKRMSYAQARAGANAWTKTQQKRGKDIVEGAGDTELLMDLDDGMRIVKLLTANAFKREGFLMRHCAGTCSPNKTTIYSLRDRANNPHVTFEVTSNNKTIQQIKGKGNGSIHPRYIDGTLKFLKQIGMDIRPTDMINLGYYHVTEKAKEIMRKFVLRCGKGPEFIPLGGHEYIFKGA